MESHGIERNGNESHLELTFKQFLEDLNVSYIQNDRKSLNGMELDFFLPNYNIAIEMNGLYWHSSEFVNKNYHIRKTEKAKFGKKR